MPLTMASITYLWLPESVEKPLRERHVALTLGYLSEIPREVKGKAFVYKQSHMPLSLIEVFQQIRERMEAIVKGTVSDHWSTVI